LISYLDDAKNRLEYTEKEFEQLKQDYYNLNIKQSELLKTCSILENENENLLNSIEKLEHEKLQLTETFENEIKKLNEHHKHELLSTHQQTDHNPIDLDDDIQSLQLRINNYENVITQYEEYRVKLENNLQKLTQQRDTYKIELRLTKEMLTNKENDCNQLRLHSDQGNQHLQTHQEQFRQYETTITDLQRQIKQYELQTQELNQTRRLAIIQVSLIGSSIKNIPLKIPILISPGRPVCKSVLERASLIFFLLNNSTVIQSMEKRNKVDTQFEFIPIKSC